MYDQVAGPYRFDRRYNDRWPIEGKASAFRLGGLEFGTIHELDLTNYSDGGLAAVSPTPIEPGSVVSLGFDGHGMTARRAIVRRCMPCGDGYAVAMQFEGRLAA